MTIVKTGDSSLNLTLIPPPEHGVESLDESRRILDLSALDEDGLLEEQNSRVRQPPFVLHG
jgi:hypothetical protein